MLAGCRGGRAMGVAVAGVACATPPEVRTTAPAVVTAPRARNWRLSIAGLLGPLGGSTDPFNGLIKAPCSILCKALCGPEARVYSVMNQIAGLMVRYVDPWRFHEKTVHGAGCRHRADHRRVTGRGSGSLCGISGAGQRLHHQRLPQFRG